MIKKITLLSLFVSVGLLFGCSRNGETKADAGVELTLFVAASLTDVIQEIGIQYEADTGNRLVFNFAGSGALAQQLMASPKADLFLSASERWMSELDKKGGVMEGTRETLLSNGLVLIGNKRSEIEVNSVKDICHTEFSLLALGDPASVPAGKYAKAYLENIECGDGTVWNAVEGRVSPAPDVRAALAQVAGSEDVLGFVYRTDAFARAGEVKILFEVPLQEGPKIEYPVAVVAGSQFPEEARGFIAYMKSDYARGLLAAAGFIVLE